MEVFAQFDDEFTAITESIGRKLASLQGEEDRAVIDSLVSEAEADVRDGRESLGNIEREMRHWSYDLKSKSQGRLRTLRIEFDSKQEQLKKVKDPSATSILSRSDQKRWQEQRKRLLGTNQMVDNTSISLDRTVATLAETTASGAATSAMLQSQREVLIRSRETIRETDGLLVKSRKTLRRISRRVVTNKIVQALIILLEICTIVLIVYFKTCSAGCDPDPPALAPLPAP
jgi:hypothetical protein